MSRPVPPCGWLLLALALPVCAASSDKEKTPPADKPPPGFHDVTLNQGGGHKMTIRVADEPKKRTDNDAPSDGHYDPEHIDYNKPSSYANKSFDTSAAILSKDNGVLDTDKHFNTGAYATQAYKQSDRTFQTAAYKTDARNADAFSKSYPLPGAATESNKAYAVKNSDLQGKKALLADKPGKTDPFAAPGDLTAKKFYDPMLTHVRRDPNAAMNGLDVARLADLPNRTLTIDEVRNLINHEQVPDLNSKPDDEQSKALNDPGWEPPDKLPSLDDKLAPITPPPLDETKADELPSPGMMAQPGSTAAPAASPKKK